jgi:hypothetical protein
MKSHVFGFALLSAIAIVASEPAQAQHGILTRSFVSSSGVDTNPCTIAAPCASFAEAYTKVGANGIIAALDPGKYGPLTGTSAITGPVTINGNGWAAITAPAQGSGITINAVSGNVILTGLEIDGAEAAYSGIVFNSGGSLTVTNCIIQNLNDQGAQSSAAGILIQPSSTQNGQFSFVITNNTISNNFDGTAIFYGPSNGVTATGIIDHVVAANNAFGFAFDNGYGGSSTVAVSNSIASNNTNDGISISDNGAGTDASPNLIVSIDNTAISGNFYGIYAARTSKVLLGRSAITGNTSEGIANGTNYFFSYKDNRINGNGTDVSGPQPTTDGLQ